MNFYRDLYPTWNEENYKKLCTIFPIGTKDRIVNMSKGMQRQAALMIALSVCPKYILLDEIFDGLDPVVRQLIKKLLMELVAENKTSVIIASHNLRELEDVCDHIGLIHSGGIVLEKELDEAKLGIIPGYIHKKGHVGVISRSGTLTYEATFQLTAAGIGQTTAIGIGGDPVKGTDFIDALEAFKNDPDTLSVLMIGEIGGTAEEDAAKWIKENMPDKPVTAFIAGRQAPPGKRMGHAGAIISGGKGTAADKIKALNAVGIEVADTVAHIGETVVKTLKKAGIYEKCHTC